MPCQIGITHRDPEERKKEWEKDLEKKGHRMTEWEVLTRCYSKSAAQKKEEELARQHKCNYHPGGVGPVHATWYVYKVSWR